MVRAWARQLTRCSQGYSRHESPTSHVCTIEDPEQLAPSSITTTSATTGFFSASSTSSLFGCPRTWLQTRPTETEQLDPVGTVRFLTLRYVTFPRTENFRPEREALGLLSLRVHLNVRASSTAMASFSFYQGHVTAFVDLQRVPARTPCTH